MLYKQGPEPTAHPSQLTALTISYTVRFPHRQNTKCTKVPKLCGRWQESRNTIVLSNLYWWLSVHNMASLKHYSKIPNSPQ